MAFNKSDLLRDPAVLWQRARDGSPVAVIGRLPEAPTDVQPVHVHCSVAMADHDPLLEARRLALALLGEVEPARKPARRGRKAAEPEVDEVLAELLDRLAHQPGPTRVVVMDHVEAAEATVVAALTRVVERTDGKLPLVLVCAAEPGEATSALLAAVVRRGGEAAVFRREALAAGMLRGLPVEVVRVLRAAGRVGEEFAAGDVAALLGCGLLEVLERLQAAADLGVEIAELGGLRFKLDEALVRGLALTLMPSLARAWDERLAWSTARPTVAAGEVVDEVRPAVVAVVVEAVEALSEGTGAAEGAAAEVAGEADAGRGADAAEENDAEAVREDVASEEAAGTADAARGSAVSGAPAENVAGGVVRETGTESREEVAEGREADAARVDAAVAEIADAAREGAAVTEVAEDVDAKREAAEAAGEVNATRECVTENGEVVAAERELASREDSEADSVREDAAVADAMREAAEVAGEVDATQEVVTENREAVAADAVSEAEVARETVTESAGAAVAADAVSEVEVARERVTESAGAAVAADAVSEVEVARERETESAGAAVAGEVEAAGETESEDAVAVEAAGEVEAAREAVSEGAAVAAERVGSEVEAARDEGEGVTSEGSGRAAEDGAAGGEGAEDGVEGLDEELVEDDLEEVEEEAEWRSGEMFVRGKRRPGSGASPPRLRPKPPRLASLKLAATSKDGRLPTRNPALEVAARLKQVPQPLEVPQVGEVQAAEEARRSGDLLAAAEYYRRAGRDAAEMGAPKLAVAHIQQALTLLQGLPRTPERRRIRGEALLELGQLQWQATAPELGFSLAQALTTLEAAAAELGTAAPTAVAVQLCQAIAGVCFERGDAKSLVRALQELSSASKMLLADGDQTGAARLLNDQAAVLVRIGDPVQALHLLRESRKVFQARSEDDPVALRELAETDHLFARLPLHAEMRAGRELEGYRAGLSHAQKAERSYRQLGDARELGRVWETMGRLELRMEQLEMATKHLESAVDVQMQLGDLTGLARTTEALSEVLGLRGRDGEAIDLLRESIQFNRNKGSPLGLAINRQVFTAMAQRLGSHPLHSSALGEVEVLLAAGERELGTVDGSIGE